MSAVCLVRVVRRRYPAAALARRRTAGTVLLSAGARPAGCRTAGTGTVTSVAILIPGSGAAGPIEILTEPAGSTSDGDCVEVTMAFDHEGDEGKGSPAGSPGYLPASLGREDHG